MFGIVGRFVSRLFGREAADPPTGPRFAAAVSLEVERQVAGLVPALGDAILRRVMRELEPIIGEQFAAFQRKMSGLLDGTISAAVRRVEKLVEPGDEWKRDSPEREGE